MEIRPEWACELQARLEAQACAIQALEARLNARLGDIQALGDRHEARLDAMQALWAESRVNRMESAIANQACVCACLFLSLSSVV